MVPRPVMVALAVVLGVVALTGCGGASDSSGPRERVREVTPTAPPASAAPGSAASPPSTWGAGGTPEAAIAAHLRALTPAVEYATACSDAQVPADVGKWCSILLSDPTDIRTYAVGPVASEIVERLTVARDGAGWAVTAREPAPQVGD